MSGREGWGIAVLRVVVGVIYVMHAYLALVVIGPSGIGGYTTRMGYPAGLAVLLAWYLIVAHGLGGLALVVGAGTRWAALAQVPIVASAFFLLHLKQGFFMSDAGGYEYTLLLLAATVALVLAGGGALAAHGRRH